MRTLVLAVIIAVTACSDGAGNEGDGGVCACRAIQVSFDRASSTLGAMNVQDAIDELAARPVPEAAVGGRIRTIVRTFENPGTARVEKTATCDDPAHDVALGGGCAFASTPDNSAIVRSIPRNEPEPSFTCAWSQPAGTQDTLFVYVVCLSQAR
jgi:hypothetical protein